jgi:hypothetical protein
MLGNEQDLSSFGKFAKQSIEVEAGETLAEIEHEISRSLKRPTEKPCNFLSYLA